MLLQNRNGGSQVSFGGMKAFALAAVAALLGAAGCGGDGDEEFPLLCVQEGGDGSFVPCGTCAPGFVNDSRFGGCIAPLCPLGLSDNGLGVCDWECAEGFDDSGNGLCVPKGFCAEGYEFHKEDGDGWCADAVCEKQGMSGKDDGEGICVREGADCALGYHDDGGGACVRLGCDVTKFMVPTSEDECSQVDLRFAHVPAGEFVAPSTGSAKAMREFWLTERTVNTHDYEYCVEVGVCSSDDYDAEGTFGDTLSRGGAMTNVTWAGAQRFCQWIGARLPTEDEWQYAATHDGESARQTKYPWGDEAPRHCIDANYFDGSTYCGRNWEEQAEPAGECSGFLMPPSWESPGAMTPLLLWYMAGDVWEWTTTPAGTSGTEYVRKGGSWKDGADMLEVAARSAGSASATYDDTGFRCAWSKD